MSEREQDEAWRKYLERYRNDGRQIHKPTGTPGYDEQEWLAFEFAWNYLQAALADRPEQPVARDEYLDGIMNRANPFHSAAPVARPEPAQPLRQFGDVRYAAAVDLVRNKEVTLSELWVVWGPYEKDGKRYPEYCAGWPEACHEHINDALDKELDEAKDWIVRQAFLAPQEPAQPVAPNSWKLVPLSLTDDMMGAFSYGLERFVKDRAPAADMNTIRANYQEAWEYLLAAAPPSHPAPSEAAPERQEKCSSAKNPLYCWNVRCQLSKTCIRAAQPAKGDASQPECEEGHECEAPKLCRDHGECFRK